MKSSLPVLRLRLFTALVSLADCDPRLSHFFADRSTGLLNQIHADQLRTGVPLEAPDTDRGSWPFQETQPVGQRMRNILTAMAAVLKGGTSK